MMKILVICQYYYPENFQITPVCEQLVADGNEVTVLTGLPNYPIGRIPDKYKKRRNRREKINGVDVIRCTEIGRRKGAIFLALNYLSFYLSAMQSIKSVSPNYDVVFTYQLSPVLMGLPSRWYVKKYKKPHLLYCCDIWPESIKMYIKKDNNIIFKWVKEISKKVYMSADVIAVQSKSFLGYLSETHGLKKNTMVYVPAFASEEYLEEDFTPDNNGVIDYVFMGNLGIAQDLSAIVKAFYEATRRMDNIRLHMVGDGTCLEQVKKEVKEYGLEDKVTFYGRRPVSEMPQYYKLADACLVSLKADNATGLTLPSKVQGYMAAGKPIIGMIDGSANEVINEAKCGICVHAGDIVGLENAFCEFAQNFEKYQSCGENGRDYFKRNFKKDIVMKLLRDQLIKIKAAKEN